jgi:hypothetical protein
MKAVAGGTANLGLTDVHGTCRQPTETPTQSWKGMHPIQLEMGPPWEGNKKSQLLQMWVSYKGFQGAQTHLSRIETCSPS